MQTLLVMQNKGSTLIPGWSFFVEVSHIYFFQGPNLGSTNVVIASDGTALPFHISKPHPASESVLIEVESFLINYRTFVTFVILLRDPFKDELNFD